MKKLLPGLLFVFSAAAVNAQQFSDKPKDSIAPLTVVIEKDPRIDVLTAKKIASGEKGSKKVIQDKYGNVLMPGYRLQVLNSTDRSLVYRTKSTLYQRFPGNGIYVVSQAPFFKLRFGNFATKDEAERYRKILAPMFPNGVYVVNDIIEARIKKTVPPEKEE